jgi:hypothetical protein
VICNSGNAAGESSNGLLFWCEEGVQTPFLCTTADLGGCFFVRMQGPWAPSPFASGSQVNRWAGGSSYAGNDVRLPAHYLSVPCR